MSKKKNSINGRWHISQSYLDSKMVGVQRCLVELDLFCVNKLFNATPDIKYGEINPLR